MNVRVVALLTVALASLCLPSGCQPSGLRPGKPKLLVQSVLGTAGVVPDQGWTELRVRLQNAGDTLTGELEIVGFTLGADASESAAPLRFRLPVEIPGSGGAPREYALPVRVDGWSEAEVSIIIIAAGRRTRFPPQKITAGRPGEFRILVVSDDPAPLALFSELLASELDTVKTPDASGNDTTWKPAPTLVEMARVPRIAEGYAPFQLVFLFEPRVEDLPERELSALEAWVRTGGTLVVAPSPTWSETLPASWKELLGIEHITPQGTVSPRPGAQRRGGELAYEVSHGVGRITCFRRSLRQGNGNLPESGSIPDLHRVLAAASARAFSFAGSAEVACDQIETDVTSVLEALVGWRIPSQGQLFLCLLGYLVVGIEIPYRLWRKARKPERAFGVMFLAALAAVTTIWLFGALTGLGGARSVEVSIARLAPRGGPAQVTSYLGLITPGFGTADLSSLATNSAAGESGNSSRFRATPGRQSEQSYPGALARGSAGGVVALSSNGSQRLVPVTLYPNALGAFRVEYERELEDFIVLERAEPGGAAVRIAPAGEHTLEVAVVSHQGQRPVRRVLPGEKLALDSLWQNGAEIQGLPALTPFWQANTQGDDNQGLWEFARNSITNRIRNPRSLAPNWSSGSPDSSQPKLGARWEAHTPEFLLVKVEKPISPALAGFDDRRGNSFFILELSPEDW